MNIVKTKKLPNNTKMYGYFDNENKDSIYKIKVRKSVFIKRIEKRQFSLEERPLTLYINKSKENGIAYESELIFGDKHFEKTQYSNPTMVEIWNKPMAFEKIRKVSETFVGNYKKNPLNFTSLNSVQSEVKDNWESMQLFVLSGEVEDPNEDYFGMMNIVGNDFQR